MVTAEIVKTKHKQQLYPETRALMKRNVNTNRNDKKWLMNKWVKRRAIRSISSKGLNGSNDSQLATPLL